MTGWMLSKLTVIMSQYISQVIMLYTLNFYSAVCPLYLNKTGRGESMLKHDVCIFQMVW